MVALRSLGDRAHESRVNSHLGTGDVISGLLKAIRPYRELIALFVAFGMGVIFVLKYFIPAEEFCKSMSRIIIVEGLIELNSQAKVCQYAKLELAKPPPKSKAGEPEKNSLERQKAETINAICYDINKSIVDAKNRFDGACKLSEAHLRKSHIRIK